MIKKFFTSSGKPFLGRLPSQLTWLKNPDGFCSRLFYFSILALGIGVFYSKSQS
jgi:hypothetical protein